MDRQKLLINIKNEESHSPFVVTNLVGFKDFPKFRKVNMVNSEKKPNEVYEVQNERSGQKIVILSKMMQKENLMI